MPRTRRRGGSDGPPTGCPLGLFDTAPYEPGETVIAAEDLCVFYSDGALLHEYPLRVGRRDPHFSEPSAGATLQG